MLETKEICLHELDFLAWTPDDLYEVGKVFCEILGVRNYLVEFLHGILKICWNNINSKVNKSS